MRETYVCPKCGGTVSELSKFWGCDNFRNGCNYKIYKNIFDIPLNEKNLSDLLENGETKDAVDGFFDKKRNRNFACRLRYNPERNLLEFIKETTLTNI